MQTIDVHFTRVDSGATIPSYAHGPEEDAGMDLRSSQDMVVEPYSTKIVPTGIAIALPSGYEAQIRSRSGLASKGIIVANSPGTIDPGYRGEIKVILKNTTSEPFTIAHKDRIAQMVIAPYVGINLVRVASLENSARGEGGFGSTGVK